MARRHAFYVTQGSLTVFAKRRGQLHEAGHFADNDEGLRKFNEYLAEHEHESCFIVVDVIEEEFVIDTIPKLGPRDRKALLQRRLQRKYPRTPYRLPIVQGAVPKSAGEKTVAYCAITNHELLDPWLQIILGHELALSGIFSVPLIASKMIQGISKTTDPILLITQHQQGKLRQVFLNDGSVQSARLSPSPLSTAEDYAAFVNMEIGRSRRYLERTRLLSGMQPLDVYIVADQQLSERIVAGAASDAPMKIHCVNPKKAAASVGLAEAPAPDRFELLYIAAAFQRTPRQSYGVSGESRYVHMRRMRHSLIAASLGVAAVCSVAAGLYLSEALILQRDAGNIEQQLVQLTETFRRENEQFDPIKADSHEMKLAVDTGDFILQNRLPVPWVMQQVGLVMGEYPDVQIISLGWSAETAVAENPRPQRRGEQPMPVPVSAITAVHADITASIAPFDGNMRQAFARIDSLVATLEERTAFTDVVAIEYPIETRPQSSIAGEIVSRGSFEAASFKLRLRYPLRVKADNATEGVDDAV